VNACEINGLMVYINKEHTLYAIKVVQSLCFEVTLASWQSNVNRFSNFTIAIFTTKIYHC